MPQKVVCSDCKEVLYEGDLLKSPQDIIKKFEGYCPKCNKKLVFSGENVKVNSAEGNRTHIEKGKTGRSGTTEPHRTRKEPLKDYKLEKYSEMLYYINHLRKDYGPVNIASINRFTTIEEAEHTIDILKRLRLVDVIYNEDRSIKEIVVTDEGNDIRKIIDKYKANLEKISNNEPRSTYYRMLEIIQT
jgi:hypothetical protein